MLLQRRHWGFHFCTVARTIPAWRLSSMIHLLYVHQQQFRLVFCRLNPSCMWKLCESGHLVSVIQRLDASIASLTLLFNGAPVAVFRVAGATKGLIAASPRRALYTCGVRETAQAGRAHVVDAMQMLPSLHNGQQVVGPHITEATMNSIPTGRVHPAGPVETIAVACGSLKNPLAPKVWNKPTRRTHWVI